MKKTILGKIAFSIGLIFCIFYSVYIIEAYLMYASHEASDADSITMTMDNLPYLVDTWTRIANRVISLLFLLTYICYCGILVLGKHGRAKQLVFWTTVLYMLSFFVQIGNLGYDIFVVGPEAVTSARGINFYAELLICLVLLFAAQIYFSGRTAAKQGYFYTCMVIYSFSALFTFLNAYEQISRLFDFPSIGLVYILIVIFESLVPVLEIVTKLFMTVWIAYPGKFYQ